MEDKLRNHIESRLNNLNSVSPSELKCINKLYQAILEYERDIKAKNKR